MTDQTAIDAINDAVSRVIRDYRCEVCGADQFVMFLNPGEEENAVNLFGEFYMLECQNCGNSKFLTKRALDRHRTDIR